MNLLSALGHTSFGQVLLQTVERGALGCGLHIAQRRISCHFAGVTYQRFQDCSANPGKVNDVLPGLAFLYVLLCRLKTHPIGRVAADQQGL